MRSLVIDQDNGGNAKIETGALSVFLWKIAYVTKMWQYSHSYIWSTGFELRHHTHGEGAKRIMWALTCNKGERHTLARYCYVKLKVKYMEKLIVTVTHGIVSRWVGTV